MSREIVTVGGGTGSPALNEALLRANVEEITAISAVTDSGGATGKRRAENPQQIAYSDAMRISLSLVDPAYRQTNHYRKVVELFNKRQDGRVLGQEFFHSYFNQQSGFSEVEEQIRTALQLELRGHVLPSTAESSNIVIRTMSGQEYTGEHQLDDRAQSEVMVSKIKLDPEVPVFGPSADAILNADIIFLSPGSFYGSVLVNFLPNGMKEAMTQTPAKLYVVTNPESTRNETHKFTPRKYAEKVEEYTGRRPDGIIAPHMTQRHFESSHPDAAKSLSLRKSHFLGWENPELSDVEREGIKIFPIHDAAIDVKENQGTKYVHYDPAELSRALKLVLHEERRLQVV